MKTGFAFAESGWIRTKNVTSILYRNYVDTGNPSRVKRSTAH